jgi:hypothetical protein
MPYIRPEERNKLNPLIDKIAAEIVSCGKAQGHDAAFAGLLNYTCTRLALKVIRLSFGGMRYWVIALVTGTFKNIADEFYRRVAAPYEDKQVSIHGDVDLFSEYAEEIRKISP